MSKQLVDDALKTVGMTEFADKPPHFLSLGQKKRVALAGVLAMQPEVIIMDEPTQILILRYQRHSAFASSA